MLNSDRRDGCALSRLAARVESYQGPSLMVITDTNKNVEDKTHEENFRMLREMRIFVKIMFFRQHFFKFSIFFTRNSKNLVVGFWRLCRFMVRNGE